MVNQSDNALVGKPAVLGGLFVAPTGTALPVDESSTLNAAFVSVGYLTDDGLTRGRKPSNDTKKAWGGDTLVVINKGTDRTVKFGLAEYLSKKVNELVYGVGNVVETAATSTVGRKLVITDREVTLPKLSWVVQLFHGTKTGRIVIPAMQINDFDDITYKDEDLAAYKVTATQFADATGAYSYEYWNDGKPNS
jgi:hypothetical protein